VRTFRAEKADSGYEIIPSKPLDRPAAYAFDAIPGDVIRPVHASAGFTKYTPSDVENLFLEFLNTETDGPSVLAFAKKYGLLGLGEKHSVGDGELLAAWVDQIHAVGNAFWWWEMHEGRYPWQKGQHFVDQDFRRHHSAGLANEKTRMGVLRPWLLREIAKVVDENLGEHCGHGFEVDEAGTFAWLREQPKSLLGVIWLQVAWHLTGKTQWRECALDGCHNWFPISNEKPGPRQKFCKDAHRVAACKRRPARLKLRKRRG
jgi:hypothetical protein